MEANEYQQAAIYLLDAWLNIMKTLYLDVCTLCRPFDDQQQLRIRLETDAILLIQRHIENKNYRAITSPVHSKEVSAIRNTEERLEIEGLINRFEKTPADVDKLVAVSYTHLTLPTNREV